MRRVSMQTALLTLIFVVFACVVESSPFAQPDNQAAGAPAQMAEAEKLFNDNCAKCHGKDGRAKSFRGKLVGARNLTDAKWQAGTTDEQIVEAIKTGPGAMPSFEKKFSQEQLDSLVAYVRHFKEETKPEK